MLFVSLIRATFRIAELGFFGVVVNTRVQTPLFCGQESRAGDLLLYFLAFLPFLTNWLTVGNKTLLYSIDNFSLPNRKTAAGRMCG
jgi:hypothetical protein